MIRNYLKIAWRNLRTNKVFSTINILGLAIGLAVCLLILLYVFDETSYDRHHRHAGQLYRINTSFVSKVDQSKIASANPLVAAGLKKDFPEVEQSARLLAPFDNGGTLLVEYAGGASRRSFFEKKAYYVDPTFFDIFNYKFLQGEPAKVLSQPNTVVLSADLAGRLFGTENPVGKFIRIGLTSGNYTYTVTGVFRPIGHSHIDGDIFLSMKNQDMGRTVDSLTNWATYNTFMTYIRLREGTDPVSFEKKLTPFLRRHGRADIDAAGAQRLLSMQPVKDIHLYSKLPYDLAVNSNVTYLYILCSIAVFILVIACVNFMNLATARSQRRAKEVGIRKVIGAMRSSLVAQFLGESLLMCALALILALLLVQIFLPVFNNFTQRQLTVFGSPRSLWWIGGLTLLTGLLAGAYPAFYLSSFRPIRVLKGKLVNSLSAIFFRKGLVVFQFTISVFLILASLITWQQLNYLNRQDLGFQKDQQIVIPLRTPQAVEHYDALKNEIAKNRQVMTVAGGGTYPGLEPYSDLRFYTAGHVASDGASIPFGHIDYGYLETLGMKMVGGRAFSKDFPSDSSGIIFNETSIRKLGLDPRTAVGTTVYFDYNRQHSQIKIVGIVRDFNFQSLREAIHPYGFVLDRGARQSYIFARTRSADYSGLLANIEATWKKINPDTPFEYSFMDKDFEHTYDRDYTAARIIGCFTGLTIFIACLGLFGLAAFTAEQRVKEIGIRKVLGCTVGGIATLLSKDFVRLVCLSIVIASPLAWWAMHNWLQDFAYRVSIYWWIFPVAGSLAIAIALLTISSQAIRAALANPVNSLRGD